MTQLPQIPHLQHIQHIPIASFVGRVVYSERRVEFNDCDPYRHMTSASFLRWAVDHRFSAVHECVGADTFDLPETTGVAWLVRNVNMDFRAPALLGEVLRIESWVEEFRSYRMEVRIRMSKVDGGELCCLLKFLIMAVDAETGAPVRLPESLPSREPKDLSGLPFAEGHPKRS